MIKIGIIIGSTRPERVGEPAAHQAKSVNKMLDRVIAWSSALKNLRETKVKNHEN